MDVGVKQAQTQLSQLIKNAKAGQKVYLTVHNKRQVELVPVREKRKEKPVLPGYGMFADELIDLSPEQEAEARRLDREDMDRWLNGK